MVDPYGQQLHTERPDALHHQALVGAVLLQSRNPRPVLRLRLPVQELGGCRLERRYCQVIVPSKIDEHDHIFPMKACGLMAMFMAQTLMHVLDRISVISEDLSIIACALARKVWPLLALASSKA